MKKEATSIRLGRQMMISSILMALTPLLIFAFVLFYFYNFAYTEKVVAHLEALVERHAQDIDTYLHEKLANIRMQAASYPLEQLQDADFLRTRLEALQAIYPGAYSDLGLVTEDGRQVAYAGPYQLVRADYSHAEWFRQAIHRDEFISDVFLGIRGVPHFIVTCRILSEGHVWLLRATIDFAVFNSLVKESQIGKTGAAFIISRQGEFETERRAETSIDPGLLDSIAKQHFENDSPQFREYGGQSGTDYFLVSVPLKGGEWVLVLQQEKEDALVELYRARWVAILVLVFGGAGIVLTVVVLTRRMQRKIFVAEEEQKIMQKQVVEAGKLAAIGELAAGIAHEINNPVAIMVECAGWIKDLMGMPEYGTEANLKEIQETLQEIAIQGSRCKEITHKLLSFARKTDSRVQEVDIPILLEEIISLTHQKARFGNVTVRTEIAPDLPKITASPTELQQVILNLINNAIDAFSRKEGTIVVRALRQGEAIVIDVADNGQGIPPADLQRIFEPFYTTKPVGKGTGLGLAICYGIINKMGGDITVESELNVGTTFHVRIPVATNSTPA